MVRSMMNLITLPLSFWDYALESATRILNMVSTKKVDKTPYELWCGKVSNLSYLKVRILNKSKIKIHHLLKSPSEITSKIPMEVEGFEPHQEEVILICRSERTHRAPNRLCLNVEVEEHSPGDLNEPASYIAVMLDSEFNKCINAMNVEIQSVIDNMIWVLVDLPPGCKTIGSKWIFKKKTDVYGIVHTYKARLVTKGYTQLYGVDYEETFSPIANIRAIKILISIAAYYDYEIWQMDVKTAFLSGYLDEDIYMAQPESFVDPNHPKKDWARRVINQGELTRYEYPFAVVNDDVDVLVLLLAMKKEMYNKEKRNQGVEGWWDPQNTDVARIMGYQPVAPQGSNASMSTLKQFENLCSKHQGCGSRMFYYNDRDSGNEGHDPLLSPLYTFVLYVVHKIRRLRPEGHHALHQLIIVIVVTGAKIRTERLESQKVKVF
nr:retrotransposon protein, putative, Ty1-copia subclass [Tanacetum cinerariifolium]